MRWTISCAKLSTGSITDSRQVPHIRDSCTTCASGSRSPKEAIQQRETISCAAGLTTRGHEEQRVASRCQHYLERSQAVYDRLIAGRSGGDPLCRRLFQQLRWNAQNLGKDTGPMRELLCPRLQGVHLRHLPLGGTGFYLVSDWVADGLCDEGKGIPRRPRTRRNASVDFNDAFEQLVKDLTWKDGLPQLQFAKTILSKGAPAKPTTGRRKSSTPRRPTTPRSSPGRSPTKRPGSKSAEGQNAKRQIRAELEEARAQLQQGAEAGRQRRGIRARRPVGRRPQRHLRRGAGREQEAQQESETDSATAEVAEPSKSAGDKRLIDTW